MRDIDRPFRFTWDFCVVWAMLVVPAGLFSYRHDIGPWYSVAAFLIVAPLIATFALYGPVLLVRQVIRWGSRGRFVIRVFLSVVFVAALLFGGLLLSGFYTESRARNLAFTFTLAATAYLSWRLEKNGNKG